jgi:DNA-binding NtrC family response regulator
VAVVQITDQMRHCAGGRVAGDPAKSVEMARSRRRAVLLVEDDPVFGDLIKEYLAQDFEVIHVADSMSALTLLEAGPKIDVLLTDIVMPKGTPHGVSLGLMARRLVRDIEVIYMTGHPDLVAEAGELPDKAFVKPFDLGELTQEIRRRFGG